MGDFRQINLDEIEAITADVTRALRSAENCERDRLFLHRILIQAVLTHGGELRVDPELGAAAMAETRNLEFGCGGVRLTNLKPKKS